MFLHILVGQNTKKINVKETTFLIFLLCDVRIHVLKKCT
jgi:hypothetical protein